MYYVRRVRPSPIGNDDVKIPGRVTTHPRVLAGRAWVFYARHDKSGAWSFLPVNHRSAPSRCAVACRELLARDSSLRQILGLPRGWHAHSQRLDAEWEPSAIPSGPTHLFTCEAIPSAENADANCYGKAFVNCWVRCRGKNQAKRCAEKLMADARWQPVTEIEHELVRRDKIRKTHRKYFDQVQIDGEVLAVFSYPAVVVS